MTRPDAKLLGAHIFFRNRQAERRRASIHFLAPLITGPAHESAAFALSLPLLWPPKNMGSWISARQSEAMSKEMPDLYSSAWGAHLNREDPLESGFRDQDPRKGNIQAKLLKVSGRCRAGEWASGNWGRSAPTQQLSVLPAGSADRGKGTCNPAALKLWPRKACPYPTT